MRRVSSCCWSVSTSRQGTQAEARREPTLTAVAAEPYANVAASIDASAAPLHGRCGRTGGVGAVASSGHSRRAWRLCPWRRGRSGRRWPAPGRRTSRRGCRRERRRAPGAGGRRRLRTGSPRRRRRRRESIAEYVPRRKGGTTSGRRGSTPVRAAAAGGTAAETEPSRAPPRDPGSAIRGCHCRACRAANATAHLMIGAQQRAKQSDAVVGRRA